MSRKKLFLPKSEEVTFNELGIDSRAIVKFNKDKQIFFTSKNFRTISQYSKNELIGKDFSELLHPLISDEIIKEIWEIINHAKIYRNPLILIRKDKKYFWVDAEITPIDENGSITYDEENIKNFIAVFREINNLDKEKAIEKFMKFRKRKITSIFKF